MGLKRYLDKIEAKLKGPGRWHFLYSTFEAFKTFLYVPETVTTTGSHIRDNIDLKRVMTAVIIALIPPMLFGIWNIGYEHYHYLGLSSTFWQDIGLGLKKFVPLLIVSYLSGGIIEVIFAQIREEPVSEGYFVTGLLIPLIIPVDTPLWMVALAAGFAVLFGKEVFGGTGMNIFNPALLARAFLFFSYPAKMSGDKVWITGLPDAISQATPLGQLSQATSVSQLVSIHQHFSVADMFWGLIPGSIGETSTFAILLGGLFLIFVGIASWKIIVSAFVGGGLMAGLFNLLGSSTNMMMHIPFYEHWLLGGFAFGMVYMLTDPVSATHTEAGKWIYGFLAGSFAIFLRVVNPAYPEGVMLSILLMNAFAPLIDYIVLQFHIKRRAKIARLLNQKYLNYEN